MMMMYGGDVEGKCSDVGTCKFSVNSADVVATEGISLFLISSTNRFEVTFLPKLHSTLFGTALCSGICYRHDRKVFAYKRARD